MIEAQKGTRDILPGEIGRWQFVEGRARATFERYGFREIRTPIFESTELFARGIGEGSDIVAKEMYTFLDRKGRSLTLRPENTAPVARAFIEHGMHRGSGLQRLYYIGPMFRYERPQKGRTRQFHQIGVEVFGSEHPAVDAEALEMLMTVLQGLGIEGAGRYDGLIHDLGGPDVPGFGFAVGEERLVMSLPETAAVPAGAPEIFVVALGEEGVARALGVARSLRRAGRRVVLEPQPDKSLKAQMRRAGDLEARFVLIIGGSEIREGAGTIKNKSDGTQERGAWAPRAGGVA